MPVYQPNIPTGVVNLDVDYLNLQGNFQQANIVYGTDHYPFDNATPNEGYHNVVTTPPVVNNPPDGVAPVTLAGMVKLYGLAPYANFGLLQFSRGPSNAVPTPITSIHGGPINIASNTTVNILDFAGITRFFGNFFGASDSATDEKNVINGGSVVFNMGILSRGLTPSGSFGTVRVGSTMLALRNNRASAVTDYYWTIQLLRLQ